MCLRRSDFFDLIRDSNKSLIANQTKRHLYAEPSSKSFTFTIAAAIGNIIKSRQFNDVLSPPDDKPKCALRPLAGDCKQKAFNASNPFIFHGRHVVNNTYAKCVTGRYIVLIGNQDNGK